MTRGSRGKKSEKTRLKRVLDDKIKYVTRTLDIPLLYCFYYSRGFSDCISFNDYQIIRNTNISLRVFQEEQRVFLKEQKDNLISHYRNHLLAMGLDENKSCIGIIQKEDISVNSNEEKNNH